MDVDKMEVDNMDVDDDWPESVPRRPGFGQPVDHYRTTKEKKSPMALEGWMSHGVSQRETRMLYFINQITDKPQWEVKVFNEQIVAKWKNETKVTVVVDGLSDEYLSDTMFDFCIEELRDKAKYLQETGHVVVLDSEVQVVKSDTAVSDGLKARLRDCVRVLEDVPEGRQDWSDRGKARVLDVLHPSLFPVAFGITRAVHERVTRDNCITLLSGSGTTVGVGPWKASKNHMDLSEDERYWGTCHWLPTDVELTENGAKLQGYINNLHPMHHELYDVLEEFVTAALPLWANCLPVLGKENVATSSGIRIPILDATDEDFHIDCDKKFLKPGKSAQDPDAYVDLSAKKSEYPEGFPLNDAREWVYDEHGDEDFAYELCNWLRESACFLVQREPEEYSRYKARKAPSTIAKFTNLQVVFKLANIHLDAEHPEFTGGEWHVEGVLNDMICATAIYYYDSENITESRLAFRHDIDAEDLMMYPPQSEYGSLLHYLGARQDDRACHKLGSVLAREGRMVAFPNTLQHQVKPFKLVDPTKPGHRKILAMFLVDPHRPILSTSNVPPQQRHWWAGEILRNNSLPVPNELFGSIMDEVPFPLSWEAAHGIRRKLMEERSNVGQQFETNRDQENIYNFCEH